MAQATCRVGVVGCGYWGSKHARVLSSVPEYSEVALIDAQPDRLATLQRTFPGSTAFATLQEALPHVDAVVIATPPSSHVALALAAIEAGKHVLIEKPMATSTFGARRLIEAADKAGVVLMAGHTFEYNGAVWKMRELINSGALGDLYYVDSARLNLGLYQPDVNVIFDLAPHDVSIINYLLGRTPDAVQAWGSRHAHSTFEDVAYLRLYYDDGQLSANVHVSWLDPCKVRRVTAVGSRKMAVYNDLASDDRIRIHDKGVDAPTTTGLTQAPMSYRYGDITSPFVKFDEPLVVQDRHFAECILTGTKPQTDGHNGLDVVQVLECAQLSLEQGRVISLDEAGSESVLAATPRGLSPSGSPRPAAGQWRTRLARAELNAAFTS